ncbi:ribosome biogenesis protein SLX9 domain-containing protein [Pochonia chlamydosporia 170]|uniref:Ribosome biogenesis protein SLX9 n=1 Tax=Pochonia chlamydosporia 170 TaxID=1380566 RepID=A0A179FU32_METCM|nr:ribosome biogenesis protein SLX9 domain-containing protein [Pochonia chlamydosporia 170]OAQ68748.1 ribosome biogenesis protein SLX9 domain-containing protein [Pochonia chlamydosporia 170]
MAPLPPSTKAPSARALRMQRITGQIHPLLPSKIFRTDAHVTDDFLNSKRDKRMMKHSSFVSRITSSKISKNKRRRPKNKLKTSLEGLADALPELKGGEGGEEILAGKVKHKSLKSKRGALKKKERIVKGEMERFGASMARLSGTQQAARTNTQKSAIDEDSDAEDEDMTTQSPVPAQQGVPQQGSAAAQTATSDRWAALRGYISATMEQNPAFAGKRNT